MKKRKKLVMERRRRRILSGIVAIVLVASLGVGLFMNSGTSVQAAGTWTVDPSTNDSWFNAGTGVTTQGGDSTKNTGRVWTDKSVYSGDAELKNEGGEPTFTVQNDEGTALVELSALSSAANISGQTTINQPLDIVLVLDRSGSMNDDYLYSYSYREASTIEETYSSEGSWGIWTQHDGGTYYGLVNGEYVQIEESLRLVHEGLFRNYYEHDHWELNGRTVTPEDTTFYIREQSSTRIDVAMENAVTSFIDTVAEENQGKDQARQHRIAITTYANNATTNTTNNVANNTVTTNRAN